MEFKNFLLTCIILFKLTWASLSQEINHDFVYPKETKYFENSLCKTSDGQDGVCRNASKCPRYQFKATLKDICSFDRDIALYCCRTDGEIVANIENKTINPAVLQNLMVATTVGESPESSSVVVTSTTDTTTTVESWIFREVDYACSDFRYIPPDPTAFVGGRKANFNEHPYMAAIGWRISSEEVNWNCGGVVISEKFVLTAAHCTTNDGKAPDLVRVGDIDLNLTNDTEIPPFTTTIRNISIHPDYRPSSYYHDIALLEINGEISKSIPACIWPLKRRPSGPVIGMGYGTRSFSGPRSNILYQGNLTIIPNDICTQRLGSNDLPNGLLDGQLCAHDPERMVDTCQGDSGGPLIHFYADFEPMVMGITSFGSFCAGVLPGIYTSPRAYLDWIESIVWPGKPHTAKAFGRAPPDPT